MNNERDEHERIALRARYENIEVTILDDEFATAVNLSHGDDPDSRWEHSYVIEIGDGTARGCSCPDHQYRGRRCKHILAVQRAIREESHDIESDGGSACPHGDGRCPGYETDEDRPELCVDCWNEWAAYDSDEQLLEGSGLEEANQAIEKAIKT